MHRRQVNKQPSFRIRAVRKGGAIFTVVTLLVASMVSILGQFNNPQPVGAVLAADPLTITNCAGNPECFAFTIDTRLNSTGATTGTGRVFAIPTSGYVNGASNHVYNWIINWGDGGAEQTVSGTGSATSAGISHTYATAGQYQITIRPVVTANGWFNAFGFGNSANGANDYSNRYIFKSIDTPFTNLMRTKGSSYRFAYVFDYITNTTEIPSNIFANISTTGDSNFYGMFYRTFSGYAQNSTIAAIPAGLFDFLDTSSGINLSYMFYRTFSGYAMNSTTATIPADLFDSIDTSSGINLSYMFNYTFYSYAYNSTTATIPADLFDSLDTSSGIDFYGMFGGTFSQYAYNSTTATIPADLFDSLDTSSGIDFSEMFQGTFWDCAYNSTTATIPAGLFDALDTSSGIDFSEMFRGTFTMYAGNSTIATIPAGLFDSLDTSSGINLSDMFTHTFSDYATRTATFMIGPTIVKTQNFYAPYTTKIGPTGTPDDYPIVDNITASQVIPTYNADTRNITAPTGIYAGLNWYRTDGTSCAVATPTPDCGAQVPSKLVTFPNNTEWTPTTSTEKGSVVFYSGPDSAEVSNITVIGWTDVDLVPKTVTITLGGVKTNSIPAGTDVSAWFTNIPAGLIATVTTTVPAGSISIPVTFSGIPTTTSSDAMDITIPASVLSSGANLTVESNPNTKWNITTAMATISEVVVSGQVETILEPQTAVITLTNIAIGAGIRMRDIPATTDITSWFTNIPNGLTATVESVVMSGDTTISVIFSGTPITTNTDAITITIPGSQLSPSVDLTVASNPNTRWNIINKSTPPVIPGPPNTGFTRNSAIELTLIVGLLVCSGVGMIVKRRYDKIN